MVDTEKAEDRYIVLRVQDNGLGIKEKDQDKLFRMYSRLNADIPGTGVGLALVKRLVENAGGKIELQSTVGEGSAFTVFLPFHQSF
jgi:signal transduction histidine kinase